jgi:glycosyltransferase involved in cell wall biosynthesis
LRIVYLLLHDFRFASLSLQEFSYKRFHFAKEYARRMSQLGHDVKLYVMADGIKQREVIQADGYVIKAFKISLRFPPFARFGNDHSLEVLRELKRDSPDLVHLHNYYLWNFPYVAAWIRREGIPLVAQYHGTDPLRKLKGFAFKPALRWCDRILVPLFSEQSFLRSLGLTDSRVIRFPSTGVDTQEFKRTSPAGKEPSFIYVGRIPKLANYRWEKAPQHLLPILGALRRLGVPARMTIVGDGPGLAPLMKRSEESGLRDAIDFRGSLEHRELPAYYSHSWFTFVPFLIEEIGPYWDGALQESLACGTPVIGFNNENPGFQKMGVLVPTDASEAAHLIGSALENRSLFSRVDDEGPQLTRRVCDWSVLTSRLEMLYEALAN